MRNQAKNFFQTTRSYSFTPEDEKIVFVSYRHKPIDAELALDCVDILKSTGLNYWFDEHDECIASAQAENSGIKIATCIEQGLDVASALLGIIGPETFSSPWIPYEIGGARGRQSFVNPFPTTPPPNPLIAHFIHNDVVMSDVPGFVGLGAPLRCLCEVEQWAKSVADILREIRQNPTRKLPLAIVDILQKKYDLHEVYTRNTRFLR